MADISAVRDVRGHITDIYISTMLLLFPLFTGFSGYGNITFSKYLFFVILTAVWLLALIAASFIRALPCPTLGIGQYMALGFGAVCLLSFLLSPYRGESLIGSGRYEGLLTQLLYVCVFLGVSLFGRLREHHIRALGISVLGCSVVGIIQLFNVDIFRLFMGSYSHYDAGYKYSGAFLGTMGNTNILSAYYCLALPVLFALPVLSERKIAFAALIPLCPALFVLIRAGVSGGFLALGLCALVALPLLLSDAGRLRRFLLASAPALLSAAAALAFSPEYDLVSFAWSFKLSPLPVLLSIAAVCCALLGLVLPRLKISPSEKALRRFFAALSLAALLAGLVSVYFSPAAEGTVYELKELMHGRLQDSFGSARILIWRECLKLFPEYPLLGSGPDTLALRLDIHFSRFVEETGKTLRSGVDNAHNEYLGLLINTGLLGLTSCLALLIYSLRSWLRSPDGRLTRALGLGCLCYCIQSFFALGLPLVSPLFLIALALLSGGPSRSPCPCDTKPNIESRNQNEL